MVRAVDSNRKKLNAGKTVHYQSLALGMALVVLMLSCLGLPRIAFNPSYEVFFDPQDEKLQDFRAVREAFAASDVLLFLVATKSRDGKTILVPEALDLVQEISLRALQLPGALRVESIINDQWPRDRDGELVVDDRLLPPWPEAGAQSYRALAADPVLAGRLLASDASLTAVAVTVDYDGHTLAGVNHQIDSARALVAGLADDFPHLLGAEGSLRVELSGITAMNHAFAEATTQDYGLFLPIMVLIFGHLLRWLFGDWISALSLLLLASVTCAATLGFAGWLGIVLSSPSSMAPFIVFTLTIAAGVHLRLAVARLSAPPAALPLSAGQPSPHRSKHESIQEAIQESIPEAIPEAIADVRTPTLLAAGSTAIGLLAFNASEVPPLRDLGNIAAIGVLLSAWVVLTVYPLALSRWHRPGLAVERADDAAREASVLLRWWAQRGQELTVRFSQRAARPVALIALLALVWGAAGLWRLVPNDEFVSYFHPRLAFRQAADLQAQRMGGLYDIEFEVASQYGEEISDPAYLAALDELAIWLRSQPEIQHVSVWTDVLRRVQRALDTETGNATANNGAVDLPEDAFIAAELQFLYELSLPAGHDLQRLVRIDNQATRVWAIAGNLDSQAMLALEARMLQHVARHLPELAIRYGSINLMFSHLGPRNLYSMVIGTLLAIVVIAVLLAMAFRSVGLGFISLLSNGLPIIAAFGLWGWIHGELTLSMASAAALAFGIVVDDTIHYLYRFARHSGEDAAVSIAQREAGAAILVTSIVLACGFAVLMASNFALNAHFAAVTVYAVIGAVLLDLLVLPALLHLLGSSRGADAGSPSV